MSAIFSNNDNNDIRLLHNKRVIANQLSDALVGETDKPIDQLKKFIAVCHSDSLQSEFELILKKPNMPNTLETRRGNDDISGKFWKAVDGFLKMLGLPPSTIGVTGAKLSKQIYGFFDKTDVANLAEEVLIEESTKKPL